MISENEFEEGIKYYRLRKGEDLPSEFCAVRDENGEPSEYTFYVPESKVAKLRELIRDMWEWQEALPYGKHVEVRDRMRELGIEVDG